MCACVQRSGIDAETDTERKRMYCKGRRREEKESKGGRREQQKDGRKGGGETASSAGETKRRGEK